MGVFAFKREYILGRLVGREVLVLSNSYTRVLSESCDGPLDFGPRVSNLVSGF